VCGQGRSHVAGIGPCSARSGFPQWLARRHVDSRGAARWCRSPPRRARSGTLASVENDGTLAVQQNAVLNVAANRPRENQRLYVAAYPSQFFGAHAVIDPFDVLLNDGAFIQVCRYVMRSGADNFDASGVGLVIRARALEDG